MIINNDLNYNSQLFCKHNRKNFRIILIMSHMAIYEID